MMATCCDVLPCTSGAPQLYLVVLQTQFRARISCGAELIQGAVRRKNVQAPLCTLLFHAHGRRIQMTLVLRSSYNLISVFCGVLRVVQRDCCEGSRITLALAVGHKSVTSALLNGP